MSKDGLKIPSIEGQPLRLPFFVVAVIYKNITFVLAKFAK
jgi:hypothetical protein